VRVASTTRRVPALMLTVCLLLLALPVATALAFPDVPGNHPYGEAIGELRALGIVEGRLDGRFWPGEQVLRAQFAKMIVGTLSVTVEEDDPPAPFTDLGPDDPLKLYPHEYVAAAYYLGITKGTTATTYSPWRDIRRAQVISMVVRALDRLYPFLLEEPPAGFAGSWGDFYPEHGKNALKAEWNELLWGLGRPGPHGAGDLSRLDPWGSMPRGEVAQVLYNLLPLVHFPLEAAEVLRVLDGDTIEVIHRGDTETLRLIGIDAPALGEPFAAEAKEALEGMLLGNEVGLQFDAQERDPLGRLLAYVWYWDLEGYAFANLDLVLQGLAVSAPMAPNLFYQDDLREAEDFARGWGRGMWGGG
jgi:endonuclease YncB( thermonuclease family)